MNRENRYLVLKRVDIEGALEDTDLALLDILIEKINNYRNDLGKGEVVAVVVAHDWPEYSHVWELIAARVDSEHDTAK